MQTQAFEREGAQLYVPFAKKEDTNGKVWVKVIAHDALTAKTPYKIIVNEYGYVTAAMATTHAWCYIGVPEHAIDSGAEDWIQIGGYCENMITPSLSVSVGHALKMENGVVADVGADYSGAWGEFAICTETTTTETTCNVILVPERVNAGVGYHANISSAASTIAETLVSEVTVTSGWHIGNYSYVNFSGIGSTSVFAFRGVANMSGIQTTRTTAQQIIGVHGAVLISGTAYSSGLLMAGVLGEVADFSGTCTEASMISCIWADWHNDTTITAGTTNMHYITNGMNFMVDNVFYIHSGTGSGGITNLFYISGCVTNDSFVKTTDTKTTHAGSVINLRISLDGTEYWMIASTA